MAGKAKPQLSNQPKKVTKGTSLVMIEHQLKLLSSITVRLLALGYKPTKIDIPQAWKYEEDGSYSFAAYIVIDFTNWDRNRLTEWAALCVKNDWSFTIGTHQGSDYVSCKVFLRGA